MAEQPPPSPPPLPKALDGQTSVRTPAQIVAYQAETTIEARDDRSSGSSVNSATQHFDYLPDSESISSSVFHFGFENGRRYHKFREGRYQFPNDESEQAREDMKHAMMVSVCGGKLFLAPIEQPRRVLDIGTGTGIWAIDVGDAYSTAEVLGIDLSPIQPDWVPENVKFMVDDAESPWLHPPNTFDFVHARHMCSGIKDWPRLISEAYAHMQPGGWIEISDQDFVPYCDDGTMREDYVMIRFLELIREGLAMSGIDLLGLRKHRQNLEKAGFINIEEKIFKVPIGSWPKNETMKAIGMYQRSAIYDGLQGLSLGPFTRGLGWSPNEVEVYLIDVRKALMDSSQHTYFPFHIFYGQKPWIPI
ncbi:S-adenosyl-L-methionine-dependent methyltransferase-19 [Coleophoma cylindrospora]|uniref:S-adenosyl-L-methionine-dependent methyltransferase-19 n=1 Tax=Coleophoma cylindrospora TaxID=1849047 RepID=A0A3D8S1T4_9HELO|nr:S-adenosyl-L-methionine-dependent methyltransferase-19 [Coleophoma cylindrospora]